MQVLYRLKITFCITYIFIQQFSTIISPFTPLHIGTTVTCTVTNKNYTRNCMNKRVCYNINTPGICVTNIIK